MSRKPERAMPAELRELADVALDDADSLYHSWIDGERQMLAMMRTYLDGVRAGADQVAETAIAVACSNIDTTFAFAHKLSQARDIGEFIRLQLDFCQKQSQALATQMQDLGETLVKAGELASS